MGKVNAYWQSFDRIAFTMAIGTLMARDDDTVSPLENILVDGHVHLHSCYDLNTFLESAKNNFCDVAGNLDLGIQFGAVILLTESLGTNYFASLARNAASGMSIDGWRFQPTLESESLIAVNSSGFELTIIAGRQIVAAEKLEVLAICTDALFDDGGPISEVIDAVSAADGIAIVPWGFGKWTGRRKKVINRLMSEFAERPFHLGDNSGRASLWREPSQFERARSHGQLILRGTDPMPFPGQENRVGNFGFCVRGPFSKSWPAQSIRSLLGPGRSQPISYGALETAMVFARHQIMMQTRKWRSNTWLNVR
jgi:hypothetical protein